MLNKYQKPILFGLLFGLLWVINPPVVFANVDYASDEYIDEYVPQEYILENIFIEDALEAYASTEYPLDEYLEHISEEIEFEEEIEEIIDDSYPLFFRTTANLRLRTGPSLDSGIIRTVSSDSIVTVHDRRDGVWFAVTERGTNGYMYAEFLIPIPVPSYEPGLAYISQELEEQINTPAVELVDWWDVRNTIIRTGVDLHITDVRTGITFWVRSFSNGNHADVETITREDTDAMLRAYNGRWSWDTRPVWVTVDGRRFAASINGMPHAGSTNSNNGMNGHVCLHFLNSRTHSGNRSHERDHQNSVQEAFRAGN